MSYLRYSGYVIIPVAISLAFIGFLFVRFGYPYLPPQSSSSTSTLDPTLSPTPLPTLTFTPSATHTPSATPTTTPTPTATPQPKPSAIPTASYPKLSSVPSSGKHSRQYVATSVGTFLIDIIAAELSSTKVVVDTASSSDCSDNCPVMSLGTYVSRNNAWAAINGSYFCPASYPSCQGKSNSFDTLLMNKNKYYFNSSNNVYSSVPAVIFGGSWVRFVGASSEWGRDTGIDGMLANHPLLLSSGSISFGGNQDPKQGSIGARSFVASKGNTVYIGVVRSATVAQVAYVAQALGLDHALNLDSGGSTALWYGGYKFGPGRDIPNAILFISR